MIISTEFKFIFIHIPKTAGTSVTDAFGLYGRQHQKNLWRSFTRRLPFKESPEYAHFKHHDPARKMVQKLTAEIFNSFLSFSVVRNPFDHAVSHYEYMKQFRISRTAKKVGAMSFADYLNYRQKPALGNNTIFARMPDQSHYLIDETGTQIVNRLIRFENLNVELSALAKELNLPSFELRHINKTKSKADKRPYQSYYTPETEAAVRDIYNRDFRLLAYSDTLS